MASTNLAKTLYFAGGFGALLGGGYIAKPLIFGEKISELIKKYNPEKVLLNKTSFNYGYRWVEAWYQYRKANKDKEIDVWGIADWNKELDNNKKIPAPTSFIDACDNNAEKSVISIQDILYKQVLDWCTSNSKISVKDLIKNSGKRALNENDPKSDANYGWTPLWKSYLNLNKGREVDFLNLDGWQSNLSDTDTSMLDKFIEKCKALSQEKVESTFDPIYQKVNTYCSGNIHAEDIIRDSYRDRKLINLNEIKKQPNALANEIWGIYVINNKDKQKGQDEWKLVDWERNSGNNSIPNSFWDNCNKKRKVRVKGIEDLAFKEVLKYCTVDKRYFDEYGEKIT